MSEIDRVGIERVMREALDHVAGPGFVHVSFDLDVARSRGRARASGRRCAAVSPTARRTSRCELVAESGVAGSLELVEANPILDRENTTALTAVELVASALGKTIL